MSGLLYAHEDADKIGCIEHRQKFGIVGEVDRGLSREFEGIVARFEPLREFRNECFERLLVADKIVVYEVDMAAVAELVKRVELREHLCVGFGAGHAPVKLDDIAELAGERTAARKLHADVEIVIELQQVEAGDRALGNVDLEFLRLKQPFARAPLPRFDELSDDILGFPDHAEIRRPIDVGTGADCGPADGDGFSARTAEVDDVERVDLLRQHAASHDQIGPVKITVRQFLGVSIDQPNRPRTR